jgi:hypothetical protein
MAYIAVVPPVRFINIGSAVGSSQADSNAPNDVLMVRAFMIYLQNFRKDLQFTNTRLTTLAGSVDLQLSKMIIDYKAFKTKEVWVVGAPEERANDRVVPQDLRFAVQAALPAAPGRNTIMLLNLDVNPLAGYGDNVVDVMCNLFPIRGMLTASPARPETDWRDLARNRVPWNQWLRIHQEVALMEYDRLKTPFTVAKPSDLDKLDSYRESSALLAPYQNELKSFGDNHTHTGLSVSPSLSARLQAVTVKVSVSSVGGQTPQGSVRLWFIDWDRIKFYYGRVADVPASMAQELRLVNGSATFTYPGSAMIGTGSFVVRAVYPDTGSFLGSEARIKHEITP